MSPLLLKSNPERPEKNIITLAKLSDDAFLKEWHTQMKMLGRNPYNMEDVKTQGLIAQLSSEDTFS
jgi:hypothetical protein